MQGETLYIPSNVNALVHSEESSRKRSKGALKMPMLELEMNPGVSGRCDGLGGRECSLDEK